MVHFVDREGIEIMPLLSLHLAHASAQLSSNLWAFVLPLGLLELILLVFALVDVIRRGPEQLRGSKLMWILIILLITTLGPICYFILGRKEA